MGSASGAAITIILLAFPLYLLWKGELPAYLLLARSNGAPAVPVPSTQAIPNATPSTQANPGGTNIIPGL